ncbi:hypothetical protein [uncultured Streptomyces sp.]|uniref:hypothetical protein n=1 Tax=uncultured Streptomyces sp. TaxID=174707 RepID=UPI002610E1FD|nr:hypothetical protein [uncultured Streptomyces sp.]
MARTERRSTRQGGHVCPACEQPVETVIDRHKTLGIYVPHWGPGPCHTAGCPRCEGSGAAAFDTSHGAMPERRPGAVHH